MRAVKQVFQNLKNGKTELVDIPKPLVKPGYLLIQSELSLISSGTERMLVDFGKANLLQKAKSQPEKVKQVLNKVKTDGVVTTVKAVQSRLDMPLPLGYSNVGVVKEIGEGDGMGGIQVGDRVLSNGPHAELVCIPKNLCAKIPDSVSNEQAVFGVVGSIGLQGIRLAEPTLGEFFVVCGLGLIGLLTLQLLRANGCQVMGLDINESRLELAKELGFDALPMTDEATALPPILDWTKGKGVDGVLVTAATKESEPIRLAAKMCRQRGRIVLVGVTGLSLDRNEFYKKELSFQVSCSYGPGRYDVNYEEKGQDYPFGYVRWTEQRNLEAVLNLMDRKTIDCQKLISHRFEIETAEEAYQLLTEGKEPHLGVLIQYPKSSSESGGSYEFSETIFLSPKKVSKEKLVIGVIGSGIFVNQILASALNKSKLRLKTIASRSGASASLVGKKWGVENSTTDAESLFKDSEINCVVVATRHESHCHFVCEGLKSGKHVFVEKPLCVSLSELQTILKEYVSIRKKTPSIQLMVGFNRRFAPQIKKMKTWLDTLSTPKSFIMTVNSGALPSNHWVRDPVQGGGRILGETCHFIDLLRFLSGEKIQQVHTQCLNHHSNDDTHSLHLTFSNGSMGSIHYMTDGHSSYPKERLEVFCDGKVVALDNFKTLKTFGVSSLKSKSSFSQEKGHDQEIQAFVDAIKNGSESPIPFDELMEVALVTFAAIESAQSLKPILMQKYEEAFFNK